MGQIPTAVYLVYNNAFVFFRFYKTVRCRENQSDQCFYVKRFSGVILFLCSLPPVCMLTFLQWATQRASAIMVGAVAAPNRLTKTIVKVHTGSIQRYFWVLDID